MKNDAVIKDVAMVYGHATVSDFAVVKDDASVCDHAVVTNYSVVYGNAVIIWQGDNQQSVGKRRHWRRHHGRRKRMAR